MHTETHTRLPTCNFASLGRERINRLKWNAGTTWSSGKQQQYQEFIIIIERLAAYIILKV